ncbi:MAG TPA: hypothetical protein VHC69_28930 [Polyangiaceae bacterium]|nr:hypothetical protein [Polyangiaceae bacterium]
MAARGSNYVDTMSRHFVACCLLASAACAACGSSDDQGDSAALGTAGATTTGGASATTPANGGSIAASGGGAPSSGSGGAPSAGGTSSIGVGGTTGSSGGSFGMGGATEATAGSSGAGGLAGAPGSGGTVATGGVAGASGAADAGGASGASGSAGSGGASSGDDPCAGGTMGPASDASGSKTPVRGYGDVQFTASTKTQITSLETTLAVPPKPTAGGTLFLWPGLEPLPGGANFNPIGTGVLQPVLTWGGTCAPNAPNNYVDWWISAQYVNTYGDAQGFTGCKGGEGMTVTVGDLLHITMSLNGTTWDQSVTDEASNKTVTFDFDLKGQAQDWAIFSIEVPTGKEPVSDIVFTSTVITTADSDPGVCTPSTRGTNDYFSAPRISADGRHCCVAKIILRGQGVPASGPNN